MGFSLKRSLKRLVTHPLKFAENVGRSIGQGAKAAAPFLPPGFREVAAVGGDIAAGGNMKSHASSLIGAELGSALGGRETGQAIGRGVEGFKTGGLEGLKRVLGGAQSGVPQVTRSGVPVDLESMIGTTGGVPAAAGETPGWGNIAVNGVKRVLGGQPTDGKGGTDWLGLAEGGLAGVSAINAARQSAQAGKYQQQALDMANQRWQEGAPLRAQASQRLLNPARPDLSQVFNDPNNAFSVPAQPPQAVAMRRKFR